MKFRDVWHTLKTSFQEWSNDNTSAMAAALAYYAVFALAPLALISVWIAGLIFGQQAARGELAHQLQSAVGPTVAPAIEDMLRYSQASNSSLVATVISIVVLVVAVLSLFGQLQDSLNTIWGVRARPGRGIWQVICDRLVSFALMVGIGVLLLASLIATSVLQAFQHALPLSGAEVGVLWRVAGWVVSFLLVTLLYAMVYRFLPDVKIAWQDVWVGAALTAVLFTVGNYLIGLYLGRSGTASAYGAAGSVVVIMLWVYYSSQVLLFGAEFTQVYANCYGEPLIADSKAVLVDNAARPRKKLAERCGTSPRRSAA